MTLFDEKPLLFETLHAFIENNNNHNQTAKKLFVHPKTIHYRMNKIKDSYNIDVTNYNDVFDIILAMKLLTLKGKAGR